MNNHFCEKSKTLILCGNKQTPNAKIKFPLWGIEGAIKQLSIPLPP
jgi:hypothetical protein